MMTPVRLLSFAIVAVTAVSVGNWSDLHFIEALADGFWTYALLGLSAIVI
ncbi:MAG: hypothetical protein IPP90_13350 [Gemmatimonadaceae bacterium]|nr:hypothetical protein [Gemmatimonadaceae bacterium]